MQYRPGDILIAGLMPVHARGNETCSLIQEIGVEAVEAMNMIIDQVGSNFCFVLVGLWRILKVTWLGQNVWIHVEAFTS